MKRPIEYSSDFTFPFYGKNVYSGGCFYNADLSKNCKNWLNIFYFERIATLYYRVARQAFPRKRQYSTLLTFNTQIANSTLHCKWKWNLIPFGLEIPS